jgi:hypothetical protein
MSFICCSHTFPVAPACAAVPAGLLLVLPGPNKDHTSMKLDWRTVAGSMERLEYVYDYQGLHVQVAGLSEVAQVRVLLSDVGPRHHRSGGVGGTVPGSARTWSIVWGADVFHLHHKATCRRLTVPPHMHAG